MRIEEVWSDLSLDFNLLEQIYRIGKFHENHIDMVNFLGVTFGHWTKVRCKYYYKNINYSETYFGIILLRIIGMNF